MWEVPDEKIKVIKGMLDFTQFLCPTLNNVWKLIARPFTITWPMILSSRKHTQFDPFLTLPHVAETYFDRFCNFMSTNRNWSWNICGTEESVARHCSLEEITNFPETQSPGHVCYLLSLLRKGSMVGMDLKAVKGKEGDS